MIATMALTAVATTGCGDYGDDQRYGSTTVDIKVDDNDWAWSNDDGAWIASVTGIEELDQYVIDYGILQTYFCWYTGDYGDVLVQEPLGSSVHWDEEGRPISETITCDYRVGEMMFYVRSNATPAPRPTQDMNFRLVIMW
jgi:hypothetical protein